MKRLEESCGEGDCCAMRGAVVDSASAVIGTWEALSSGRGLAQRWRREQGADSR